MILKKIAKVKAEVLSGERKVDKTGYVPLDKRIAMAFAAGRNTVLTRDDLYDVIEDYEDSRLVSRKLRSHGPVPGRVFGMDMAEADQLMRDNAQRVEQMRERARADKIAKQKAQEELKAIAQSKAKPVETPSSEAKA